MCFSYVFFHLLLKLEQVLLVLVAVDLLGWVVVIACVCERARGEELDEPQPSCPKPAARFFVNAVLFEQGFG